MTSFKKDYINYLLHSVGTSYSSRDPEKARVKKLLDAIIQSDDLVKIAFIVGKTAGLEVLFKYLLYISDKIDKSQVTISNLKGNFDYDIENLRKICEKIQNYKSPAVIDKLEIPAPDTVIPEPELQLPEIKEPSESQAEEIPEIPAGEEHAATDVAADETPDDSAREEGELTLIENRDSESASAEVFELAELGTEESTGLEEEEAASEPEDVSDRKIRQAAVKEDTSLETDEQKKREEHGTGTEILKGSKPGEPEPEVKVPSVQPEEPELEIEIKTPGHRQEIAAEGESTTNEAYYEFETKFFEEVKILEKLFLNIYNETKSGKIRRLSDRLRKSFKEVIEITDELSNLTRQLSFDLTADIFLTINLFFKKALGMSSVITQERLVLLNSSLSLVSSLIKGDNYLNYDVIVERIEQLKNEMLRTAPTRKTVPVDQEVRSRIERKKDPAELSVAPDPGSRQTVRPSAVRRATGADTLVFKMRWLIKDFEKVFLSMSELTGEYSKFEALEKCDELNNYLRLIAKLALSVRAADICKLAEVSYVFLKYLKDYRMDLLDPEIQQIIKYVIFTFKMLLTERKPEDFDVLVQYLNNPVKIFTDS